LFSPPAFWNNFARSHEHDPVQARIVHPEEDMTTDPDPAGDRIAAQLRGFGPVGILAMLVILLAGNDHIVPLGGLLVLVWAWRSRTPWREIGYVRPRSWIATVAAGIVFGSALKLLMKMIVMPLLGADPINQTYHYLAGNRAALPGAVYAMIVGAGFGEETVFRGYLFERFGKRFGSGVRARVLTVVLVSLGFGLSHYAGQGLTGAEQATVVGLVFGSIFARTGRIWMLIVAHAAFDLTALALIYWNLETTVAHLIFK
jgi:CAAX protease family protein